MNTVGPSIAGVVPPLRLNLSIRMTVELGVTEDQVKNAIASYQALTGCDDAKQRFYYQWAVTALNRGSQVMESSIASTVYLARRRATENAMDLA